MTITRQAEPTSTAGTRPGPPEHGRIQSAVDAALRTFLTIKATRPPDPCLPPLVNVIREFLAGGKRLRPLLCHCGWTMAGGAPQDEAVIRVAAGLELFHAFALVHDDVMDASAQRRGRPTVHRLMAREAAGGAGADRFGTNAAILIGDLCMVWSDELLHVDAAPHRMRTVRRLVAAMRTELMAGQYLDICPDQTTDSLERAWRVIRHKTATYTVERPLQIGAALAGADDQLLRVCAAYGRPLGEAFQLKDDLLGVFGDPASTGKSNVDDLREGKRTVLMLLTYQRASPRQRAALRQLHGNATLDEAGGQELRAIIRATGADEAVERMVVHRRDRAIAALGRAPIPPASRQTLTDLAYAATRRDA